MACPGRAAALRWGPWFQVRSGEPWVGGGLRNSPTASPHMRAWSGSAVSQQQRVPILAHLAGNVEQVPGDWWCMGPVSMYCFATGESAGMAFLQISPSLDKQPVSGSIHSLTELWLLCLECRLFWPRSKCNFALYQRTYV